MFLLRLEGREGGGHVVVLPGGVENMDVSLGAAVQRVAARCLEPPQHQLPLAFGKANRVN